MCSCIPRAVGSGSFNGDKQIRCIAKQNSEGKSSCKHTGVYRIYATHEANSLHSYSKTVRAKVSCKHTGVYRIYATHE